MSGGSAFLARLDPRQRTRAERVRKELRGVWRADDRLVAIANRLAPLFPDSGVCVYVRNREGRISEFVHSLLGPPSRAPVTPGALSHIEDNRAYVLRGDDRFANQAVTLGPLLGEDSERAEALRDNVLRPYGAHHQLRMALYDERHEFVGYSAFARPGRCGDYTEPERAMLQSLAPALIDGMSVMRTIGQRRTASDALVHTLELFDEAAWLVGRTGTVLFGNHAARRRGRIPQWVRRVPFVPSARAKIATFELDGRRVWLAVERRPTRRQPTAALLSGLPPSLAAVANLLIAGLTDKEIACELELQLTTVRTYTTRIYQRMGVHGRRELILQSRAIDSDLVGRHETKTPGHDDA